MGSFNQATKMNDLNLRFERNPSSRHMTYIKEQANRRSVDDAIAMAESECMDQQPDLFHRNETTCIQEGRLAKDVDTKERAERLKTLYQEENDKYEKELKETNNEHILVEKVKKSLFH